MSYTGKPPPLLYYQGPFTGKLIPQLGREVKQKMPEASHLRWKVFSVLMEMCQNLYLYSEEFSIGTEVEAPTGLVQIQEDAWGYQLTTINQLNALAIRALKQRLSRINQMSAEELRQYKNECRKTALEENLPGGSIGLAQVVLLSDSPIEIDYVPADRDQAYLILSSYIKKENANRLYGKSHFRSKTG
ncbi:MAG: hypothetical protein HC913_16075 [Microscillaceae bacterium]|nr:hypothetical protein [Microscillaceae bacterium]